MPGLRTVAMLVKKLGPAGVGGTGPAGVGGTGPAGVGLAQLNSRIETYGDEI